MQSMGKKQGAILIFVTLSILLLSQAYSEDTFVQPEILQSLKNKAKFLSLLNLKNPQKTFPSSNNLQALM